MAAFTLTLQSHLLFLVRASPPSFFRILFWDYIHVFMSWGISFPFAYLTDGNVPAVEDLSPAFDSGLKAAVCSGKPYKLVFAGAHAIEDAQNALDRLKLRADIQNYSPPEVSFQYVVATLAAPDRNSCPQPNPCLSQR